MAHTVNLLFTVGSLVRDIDGKNKGYFKTRNFKLQNSIFLFPSTTFILEITAF